MSPRAKCGHRALCNLDAGHGHAGHLDATGRAGFTGGLRPKDLRINDNSTSFNRRIVHNGRIAHNRS